MAGEKHHERIEEPVPVIQSDLDPEHEHEHYEEESEKHEAQQSIEDLEAQRPSQLYHVQSHVSTAAHDVAVPHDRHFEAGDEVYARFSSHRKVLIVFVLSFCSFLAPISSTTVLSAVPEVAATYNTSGTIINISNAMYLVFMGLSPLFWGPMGQVYGRKWPLTFAAITFTAFSIGTALAPNLASFFIFRILTAFQGTTFLIIGSSCLGDIYRPVDRATALGWFLSGTLIGPAFGPFIGGIIVTYASWVSTMGRCSCETVLITIGRGTSSGSKRACQASRRSW